jgi:MYXO-CTERM domain-containing protein
MMKVRISEMKKTLLVSCLALVLCLSSFAGLTAAAGSDYNAMDNNYRTTATTTGNNWGWLGLLGLIGLTGLRGRNRERS